MCNNTVKSSRLYWNWRDAHRFCVLLSLARTALSIYSFRKFCLIPAVSQLFSRPSGKSCYLWPKSQVWSATSVKGTIKVYLCLYIYIRIYTHTCPQSPSILFKPLWQRKACGRAVAKHPRKVSKEPQDCPSVRWVCTLCLHVQILHVYGVKSFTLFQRSSWSCADGVEVSAHHSHLISTIVCAMNNAYSWSKSTGWDKNQTEPWEKGGEFFAGLYFIWSSLRQPSVWNSTRKVPKCCILEQYLKRILPPVNSSTWMCRVKGGLISYGINLVRVGQKNFSKTCLLNKLLVMFYLKRSHCQQRTQQTSTLSVKATVRVFPPWPSRNFLRLFSFIVCCKPLSRTICARVVRVCTWHRTIKQIILFYLQTSFWKHSWDIQLTRSLRAWIPSYGRQPGFALVALGCA